MAFLIVGCMPGCDRLLGISNPTSADGGDGGLDDGGPTIDSSPACVTAAVFGPEQTFAIGGVGTAFAVAQLDHMIGRDVAIAVGTGVEIMSGNGGGTFSRRMTIATQTRAEGLVSDDFDIDTKADLVVWDEGGTTMSAIRQTSTTTMTSYAPEQPLTGPFAGVQGALVGFMDAAFVPDLLVKDVTGARPYTAQRLTPVTFKREPNTISGVTGGDVLVAVGQLDGTGGHDAAFIGAGGDVKIAFNAPAFTAAELVASEASDRAVGFGKLDGDDAVDLIVGTVMGGVIYRGGGGTFTRVPGVIESVTGPSIQVIDVNRDGKDDLVLASRIVYQCAPAAPGEPGVFSQFELIDAGGPALMVDVTGDGKPDLLRLDGAELRVQVQQ